jgi:hypothetical protein
MKKLKSKGLVGNTNSISSQSYSSSAISTNNYLTSSNSLFSKSDILKPRERGVHEQNEEEEGVYSAFDKPVYNRSNKTSSSSTISAPKKGMVLGKKAKAAVNKEA